MKKEKNLKINALLGILNTFVSMIFPLITFAYASRILAPEGIGLTQLATSVTSYFELFASLGIPLYATREISKIRDNKRLQDSTASEIFWTNLINALFMYILYVIFIIIMYGNSTSYFTIFLIYGTTIISTAIGVEWYYKAEEEFEYITIRNIVVKSLCLLLILLFVKDQSDIVIYSLIYIGSIMGYSLVNLIKFITKTKPKLTKFNIFKHIKPALTVFIMSVATTIYCSVDTLMLGYLTGSQGEYNVGIYSAVFKITSAAIAIITAINSIMLPRLSYYYTNNRIEEIKGILNTCYKIILMFSIPLVAACEILPKHVIYLISGEEFIAGYQALQIIAPIILFVSLTNLIGIQIFYSSGNIKKTIISVLFGAICNVICNSILIPVLDVRGAAIGTLVAEFTVLIVQVIIGKNLLIFKKFDKNIVKYILSTLLMSMFVLILKEKLPFSYIPSLLICAIVGILVYFLLLIILKEELTIYSLKTIINKLRRKQNEV